MGIIALVIILGVGMERQKRWGEGGGSEFTIRHLAWVVVVAEWIGLPLVYNVCAILEDKMWLPRSVLGGLMLWFLVGTRSRSRRSVDIVIGLMRLGLFGPLPLSTWVLYLSGSGKQGLAGFLLNLLFTGTCSLMTYCMVWRPLCRKVKEVGGWDAPVRHVWPR